MQDRSLGAGDFFAFQIADFLDFIALGQHDERFRGAAVYRDDFEVDAVGGG